MLPWLLLLACSLCQILLDTVAKPAEHSIKHANSYTPEMCTQSEGPPKLNENIRKKRHEYAALCSPNTCGNPVGKNYTIPSPGIPTGEREDSASAATHDALIERRRKDGGSATRA
ncbi:hypothetical protein B0H16DRAFT_1468223 [Mycena metata]|uniref:Secreted protein n=1 Tax=Mycena metata TaxID=1033252 RepID=A0AAD7I1Q1_9AGAR|nr:hypothetical protein B0H16DRAFT_1468223 [Mycena metata]